MLALSNKTKWDTYLRYIHPFQAIIRSKINSSTSILLPTTYKFISLIYRNVRATLLCTDGYVQDGNVCKVDKHEFQCLRNGYKVSSRPNPKRYIIRLINITMDFTSTQIPDVQQCKRGEKGNIGRALSHR